MDLVEQNFNGWDITVSGKRFNDRFNINIKPNMSFIFNYIKNELYSIIATGYANRNNLSSEDERDRQMVEDFTDTAIQYFLEDVAKIVISFKMDFPFTISLTLDDRMSEIMKRAKVAIIDKYDTPISVYKSIQYNSEANFRIKF